MILIDSFPLSSTIQAAQPHSYNEAVRAQFQSIPGIQWDKKHRYYTSDLIAIQAALELCESAQLAKINRSDETICDAIQPPTSFDPRLLPFQVDGVCALNQILHDYGAALLVDEMGLGKTPQGIALYDYLFPTEPIIVIAPAMVVPSWRKEVAKWSSNSSRYHIYSYQEFQSALKLSEPKKRAGKQPLLPVPSNPAAIILDEAHYLANAGTKRAEAISAFCKAHPSMKRLALTGTPFKTYVRSLHCLLDILFPSQFGTFFAFTRRYADGHFDTIKLQGNEERRVWSTDGASNLAELQARLALRSIRRTKAEVLTQLPSKVRSVIDVPLPAKVRKSFRDAAKASLLAAELGTNFSVATLLSNVEEHKLDAAEALALECKLQGHRPLILTTRRRSAEELAKRLSCIVAHGDTTPEKRLELLTSTHMATSTIDACQVGITLTNFDVIIFVGFDWDPTKLLQAEDRIHRIGQQDSCLIYYLCGESSIDEIVRSKVIDRLDIFAKTIGKEDSNLTTALGGVSDEELLASWAKRIEET